MAYDRTNFLTKVVEIQDIVMEHKKKGCTQKWVYENVIRHRYHISSRTFNNYLSLPAKLELRKKNEKVN